MAELAIHTLELGKRYGSVVALAGLTMDVRRGEVFGFLGPNGSGKTTAVKLLLGLTRPSSGEAWVMGMPAGHRATRRRVGYLPELFRYQAWLSAHEVLALHCELAGLPRAGWDNEIRAALATVNLSGRAGARVATFSKGMQQRLGLAVALLGQPDLVILDEPTSALDPVGRHETRAIIRELSERGCAVFLNSHLLSEVEQVCHRVAVITRGRVLATGSIDELLAGDAVRLRLDDVGNARAVLSAYGQVVEDDSWITVRGVSHDAIPKVIADLVAAGAGVYAVEPVRQTLEERFLALLQDEEDA